MVCVHTSYRFTNVFLHTSCLENIELLISDSKFVVKANHTIAITVQSDIIYLVEI